MSDVESLKSRFAELAPWTTRFEIDGRKYGGWFEPKPQDIGIRDFLERLPPNGSVLELACLEGGRTVHIARRAHRVVAIELRPENLARARLIRETFQLENVSLLQGNIEEFDFGRLGRFDVIYNVGLLYHLLHPLPVLHQLAQVAPAMYLATHTAVDGPPFHDDIVEQDGYRGMLWNEPDGNPLSGANARSFWPTQAELVRMLNQAGFARIEFTRRRPRTINAWCWREEI